MAALLLVVLMQAVCMCKKMHGKGRSAAGQSNKVRGANKKKSNLKNQILAADFFFNCDLSRSCPRPAAEKERLGIKKSFLGKRKYVIIGVSVLFDVTKEFAPFALPSTTTLLCPPVPFTSSSSCMFNLGCKEHGCKIPFRKPIF